MTYIDVDRPAWMADAECRGAPPELFFPVEQKGEAGARALTEARAICRRCDVQAECLAHALNTDEPDGIWGGFTAAQRKRIRRRQSAA